MRRLPSEGGLGLRFGWLTVLSLLAGRDLQAAEGRIPELRSPRGPLPPSFWEQHGWMVVAGAILLLGAGAVAWWLARRPRPSAPPAPELDVQRALEALQGRPEDVGLAIAVAKELRRYVLAVVGCANDELTTEELVSVIRSQFPGAPELPAAATQLLSWCDQAKFAPMQPHPEGPLVAHAIQLIQRMESARPRPAVLERAEAKPAAPPAP